MKKPTWILSCVIAVLFLTSAAKAQNKTKAKRIDAPTANFELCLGNNLVPKATFTNVSTAAVNVKAQLLIVNVVTGIRVYGDTVDVMNLAAGSDITVTFDTFKTNINILSQLGTFNVFAIGPAMNSSKVIVGDALASDDTMRSTLFGIRRTSSPWQDPSNTYSMAAGLAIPDQHRWLSIGATVVEGDDYTFDPPSPRDPVNGYGSLKLHSPVIKLDRLNHAGVMYTGTANGDTLSSYPMSLKGVSSAILAFDYHRSSKRQYQTWYDYDTLHGAENHFMNGAITRRGDSLILEFKKQNESACGPSANGWTQIAAIDGGKDFEFQRFRIAIESKNVGTINYFTEDFRFRLRLKAKADPTTTNNANAIDDEDPWYIDNIKVTRYGLPEYTMDWVRVVTPYTKVPASQAIFPVYLKISNHGPGLPSPLPIIVQVVGPDGKTKYWERMTIKEPSFGRDTIVQFPNWDARGTQITNSRECTVNAWIDVPWNVAAMDYDENDNHISSKFYLNVESGASLTHEFAYDDGGINPGQHSGNDWPVLVNRQGAGVGFNNNSGSYAIKVKLMRPDTLYGIRAYFARGNAANDPIKLSVYEGSDTSNIPGALVNIPGISTSFQDERRGNFFDQFWPYYFPKPVVLQGVTDTTDGVYWIAVSQLGLDNMMLGADISRSGYDYRYRVDTTLIVTPIHTSKYATQYSANDNAGDISSAIAFEVTAQSGNWYSFEPKYAVHPPGSFSNNGIYIPMIRALFGRRILLPVEYAKPLAVTESGNAALLTWTTATETNNRGFFVQRLVSTGWEMVAFVESRSSNSSTPSGYSYVDENLIAGTYKYRLIQTDLDGTESLSNVVEVTIASQSRVSIAPNPFDPGLGSSRISVDASFGEIKVTVVNSLGQEIRSMLATGTVLWDGKDDNGALVPNGSYIIRLQANGLDEIRRLSVVK